MAYELVTCTGEVRRRLSNACIGKVLRVTEESDKDAPTIESVEWLGYQELHRVHMYIIIRYSILKYYFQAIKQTK